MKHSSHPVAPKTLVIAAFAAIYIIWGSTYLGILLAIKTIPPFFMAGIRFFAAGLLLLIWGLFRGEKIPDLRSLSMIALSGILMLFIGNGAVTWVEQFLPSGLVAIIVATVPLWFVLLDRRQWKFYFSNKQIIAGLCIGFAGVILLFSGKAAGNLFSDKMSFISLLVLLAGTISWTAGSLYAKYRKMNGSTLMKVSVQMIAAGVAFFALAFTMETGDEKMIRSISWQSILAVLYLIIMGSMVAYMAYMWLLSVRPASLVGTYAYVNPVVAMFLGWLIANETISTRQVIGLSVIIAGLIIVNISKEKKQAEAAGAGKDPTTVPIEMNERRKTS
ncbi:MAG TPA: EamA family transporter [Flavisolibacter sp.]|nr:EamA family transporter [Flavisolibacter sp.]